MLFFLLTFICISNALIGDPNARIFTLSELRKYDGKQEKDVFLSLKGIVFNVTSSGYYAKGRFVFLFSILFLILM